VLSSPPRVRFDARWVEASRGWRLNRLIAPGYRASWSRPNQRGFSALFVMDSQASRLGCLLLQGNDHGSCLRLIVRMMGMQNPGRAGPRDAGKRGPARE